MNIVRAVLVGISALLISANGAWAAESSATPAGSATAGKSDPTPKAEATVAKGDPKGIKDTIVGKWKSPDDGEVMDFAADGNVRIQDPNALFMGTYELLADGTLHMEIPAFKKNKDFVYQVDVKGDELTLTLKDQKPRKYNRLK